jgi:hypothetical protein
MHVEVFRRAVRRDDDAAGGRQRVIVDDRNAGLSDADLVAEQCGTGLGPGKVAGIVRPSSRWSRARPLDGWTPSATRAVLRKVNASTAAVRSSVLTPSFGGGGAD